MYQTDWMLKQKLQLSTLAEAAELLTGLVEVDLSEISFRSTRRCLTESYDQSLYYWRLKVSADPPSWRILRHLAARLRVSARRIARNGARLISRARPPSIKRKIHDFAPPAFTWRYSPPQPEHMPSSVALPTLTAESLSDARAMICVRSRPQP